ncbi:hypothetical protein NE619_01185 [Anaerovorax odorimutans]|uniref:Uncharacterized protein n=1 Tax=Anaerovorax odorimutans TaxID=109327 RepID=A0ABT1RJJ2_9FIRM|nr:hypothetical protein [Anaerovorax odorimutans]MCQ4635329.1 hypothetical protein [Anaerovorax odorimutans]
MDHFAQYFLHSEEENFIIKGELIRESIKTFSSNRSIKDSVFRLLFDDEENLLSLFNALEDTHYTKKSDIRINTLKGAIFNKVRAQ